uniref:Geranylgeranyl transferase type-2 subunit alpha n=2 Tax=Pseudo-nitzschia australis TaxID=44445 RepID=A0A7S4EI02_9STRA
MGTQAVTINNDDHGNFTTTQEEGTNVALIPTELIQSEFDFTTEKIQQNFSNFSAFHYRSQLLDLCHCNSGSDNGNGNGEDENDKARATVLERIMEEEFQLIEDAVCTEPDDQTCWWYHAILLDKLLIAASNGKNINSNDSNGDDGGSGDNLLFSLFRPRLQEQAELFREILEDSPDCKWVILGLFRVLEMLGTTDSEKEREENDEAEDEQEKLLQRLMEIDPYRSKRYEELRMKLE